MRALLTAAYPLLSGRATHGLTAAATAATVWALLSDEPRACTCRRPPAARAATPCASRAPASSSTSRRA